MQMSQGKIPFDGYPPDILSWMLSRFSRWLLPRNGDSPFVWSLQKGFCGFMAVGKHDEAHAAFLRFRIAWPPHGKSFAECGETDVSYDVLCEPDARSCGILEAEALDIIRKMRYLQEKLPEIRAELFPGLERGFVRWSQSPIPLGRRVADGGEKDVMIKLNELACGLQCAFCTRSLMGERPSLPELHLIDQLYRAALNLERPGQATDYLRIGVDEPTRHPYLKYFISLGAHLGYRKISLQSVAAGLKSREDVHELASAGLSDVQMPLYGLSAAVHDGVVGCPGHFGHLQSMIDAFLDCGVRVTLHSVPIIENHADITELPQWCSSKGVDFHGYFFPRYEGPCRLPIERIMPRLSDLHPELRSRLDLFIPCLGVGTRRSRIDGKGGVREVVSETGLDSKASFACFFGSQCDSCAERRSCSGVYKGYLELHGDAEFVPIKKA